MADSLLNAALLGIGGPSNLASLGVHAQQPASVRLDEIVHAAGQVKAGGAKLAILCGGEPTLRQDFRQLLAAIRASGLRAGLVTNGRMLAYPKVRTLVGACSWVRILLHGPNAASCDEQASIPGAFEIAWTASSSLAAQHPGLQLELACPVYPSGAGALRELVESIARLGCDRIAVRFQAPFSGANTWPSRSQTLDGLGDAAELARSLGVEMRGDGFPNCWWPSGAARQDHWLRFDATAIGCTNGDPIPAHQGAETRAYRGECNECTAVGVCPGIPQPPGVIDSTLEIAPTHGVRANSFNYVFRQRLAHFVPAEHDCDGVRALASCQPDRCVVVDRGDDLAAYETSTGDFATTAIRRVKYEHGEVFAGLGTGGQPVDFLTGVRRALPVPACQNCSCYSRTCPGVMRPESVAPFAAEKVIVHEHLRKLRGTVLDVGCGACPYSGILEPNANTGDIVYHALDPDSSSLQTLAARCPQAITHPCSLEQLGSEHFLFDHVLMMRSVNHFADFGAAMTVLSNITRVGSSVIAVDSPVFALVRDIEIDRTVANSAEHDWQHFRNLTSEQFVQALSRYPFRVTSHYPVSVDGFAEWIVVLERTANRQEASSQ